MTSIAEILQWAEHEDVRLSTDNGRLSVGDNRPEGHSAALSEAITANRLALIDWLQAHAKPTTPPVIPVLNGHAPPKPAKATPISTDKLPLAERHELENILQDVLFGSMSAPQFAVLLYIARHTLGFNRIEQPISIERFCTGFVTTEGKRVNRGTGLKATAVKDAIKYLEARGLVSRRQQTTRFGASDATIYTVCADVWRAERDAFERGEPIPEPIVEDKRGRGRLTTTPRRETTRPRRETAVLGVVKRLGPVASSRPPYMEIEENHTEGNGRRVRGTSRAARDPTTTHPP